MEVKDIKKVVVAGGGVLGSQIAFQSAYSGYDVTIWLRSEGSIGRCQPKVDRLHKIYLDTLEAMKTDPRAYAYGLVAKEECTPEKCEALKANVEAAYKNLKLTTSWDEAFNDADYVIEAVAEDPKQKEDFYTELQKHLPEKTFVVTNSSTLLPSTFAHFTGRPEKFLALHFANDIWKMPTAEVMRHAGTGDEAFELTIAFAKSIRMVPLKVNKEVPGYLLNSMLVPFLSAAEALWAGGVGSVEDIDRAWTMSTGAPSGPFRILDIVGLQTAYNIVIMDPRVKDPTTIQSAIAAGLKEKIDKGETGINAGIGFYDYRK
jgi:3-hydroxybutyryl-CoA dehydrogenase